MSGNGAGCCSFRTTCGGVQLSSGSPREVLSCSAAMKLFSPSFFATIFGECANLRDLSASFREERNLFGTALGVWGCKTADAVVISAAQEGPDCLFAGCSDCFSEVAIALFSTVTESSFSHTMRPTTLHRQSMAATPATLSHSRLRRDFPTWRSDRAADGWCNSLGLGCSLSIFSNTPASIPANSMANALQRRGTDGVEAKKSANCCSSAKVVSAFMKRLSNASICASSYFILLFNQCE